MLNKRKQLDHIYNAFKLTTAEFRQHAVCAKGCAYCCTGAGHIDMTTLEGWAIQEAIACLPRVRQTALKKRLAKDMKKREGGKASTCPFLMKNRACTIYAVRPFACRRIYSLQVCSQDQAPILSRQVMRMGVAAIHELQQLDDTGYSGHIAYILHMLDQPSFRKDYLAGKFYPEQISDFGKAHQIVINRIMTKGPHAPR